MALEHPVVKIKIQVPTSLRRFTGHQSAIEVHAATAGEALRAAGTEYPMLRGQLFAADNSLRNFINIFVNDRDIRTLQNEGTALQEHDVVTILPAMAGG